MKRLEELIAQGVDVNTKGSGGTTALYDAVVRKRQDVVEFLLEHGADVTIKHYGIPLLASASTVEIAKMLVDHGSDPNTRSDGVDGYATLFICIGSKIPLEVIEVLAKSGELSSARP